MNSDEQQIIVLADYIIDILEEKIESSILTNVNFTTKGYGSPAAIDFVMHKIPSTMVLYDSGIQLTNNLESTTIAHYINEKDYTRLDDRIHLCYNECKTKLTNFYSSIIAEERKKSIDNILLNM